MRSEAPRCEADTYPRTLSNVLSDQHRRHLVHTYFKHVHQQRSRQTYYNLLRRLVEADEDEYRTTRDVLASVRERIAQALSPRRFVVINDFFSYRSADTRLFPQWHQDYEFWLTGSSRCTNFNLWVMLDHVDMNHSFDLYEARRNEWLYTQLYRPFLQRRSRSSGRRHHNLTDGGSGGGSGAGIGAHGQDGRGPRPSPKMT